MKRAAPFAFARWHGRLTVAALAIAVLTITLPAESPPTLDEKIGHVLNRVAYGPSAEDVAYLREVGLAAYLEEQLHPEPFGGS